MMLVFLQDYSRSSQLQMWLVTERLFEIVRHIIKENKEVASAPSGGGGGGVNHQLI